MASKLDIAIADLNKKFKQTIAKQGIDIDEREKIPFTSPRLNYMTYGGIPLGIAMELFGPESGGKTTTALDLVGNAQRYAINEHARRIDELTNEISRATEKKQKELNLRLDELINDGPRQVIYIDAENTLDERWARLNGVDVSRLILIRPQTQTAEQILQMILDVVKTGQVICIVLDSIPMLVSQQLFEESMEKKAYCGVAGPLSIFSARIAPILNENQTLLIMINQVRENLDNPYVPEDTPGGRAIKHLFAVRLMCRKGSFINELGEELNNRAETPAGNLVNILVAKTKVFKPDRRQGFYTLSYNNGIDNVFDIIDLSIKDGLILKSGSWFTVQAINDNDEVRFQGKMSLANYLRENTSILEQLNEQLKGGL